MSEKRLFGMEQSSFAHNFQIITEKEIQQMPVQSVNEALQYITGVDLRQRGPSGAQADISMMGSTFEQVLILVNGIPLRDPQTGHNQLNLPFDLSMIHEIEVIKGSAARLYGANAMAGAINIKTKTPGNPNAYFQAYSSSPFETDTASSDTYYGLGLRAGAGFRTKNIGHQIDLGYQKTNGYRYNSGSEQQRVNYMGTYRRNNSTLNWMAGTLFNEFGANGFYSPKVDKNAIEKVNTTFGSVKLVAYRNKWKISPLAYVRYNHDDYNLNAFNYQNNHFSTTAGAEVHTSVRLNKYEIGAGYESRAEIIRSNNLGKHERFYNAIYTELRRVFSNSAQITAGINAQHNNDYGWNFYPGIEASTPVFYKTKIFANAGLANRLPTYTDLYYSDSGNIGNSNLKPENAFNTEFGVRVSGNQFKASASAFIRDITDFIDFVRENANDKYQPRNFQHVQIKGFDVNASYKFSSKTKVRIDEIKGAYTYLDATLLNNSLESKYALQHLRHQVVGSVNVKIAEKIALNVQGRYNERIQAMQYALLDARIKYTAKHWNFFADVSNILDRYYVESGLVPMPGRWYRIGFGYSLN
ncbi:MAG: TonB-dependent receptor [Flavobacteriales bacterium]